MQRRPVLLSCLAVLALHAPASRGAGRSGGAKSGAGPARAMPFTPGRIYGPRGEYLGRVDERGRRYDARGQYLGRTDADGRRYDARGAYMGRIEPQTGRFSDAHGRTLGVLEGGGRLYDSQGRYLGRVTEDGQHLGPDGRPVGPLPRLPMATAGDGAASAPASGVPPVTYCRLGEPGCSP